tara:strand:+ start:1149 stop:1637 length:489 start_codon:yes stop_codon:yes gene_type:complete
MKASVLLFTCVLISCGHGRQKVKYVEKEIPSYNYEVFKEKYLSAKTDNIRLLNFWATWCKPCVAELPYFIEFAQENENVELILVNLDMPSQVEKLVKPFLKRENIAQTVVHLNDPNSNFWINDIDSSWSGAIPATLIIKDEIKQFYEGSLNLADLNRIINNE